MNKLSNIVNTLFKEDEKVFQLNKKYFAEDEITFADISVELDGVGNIGFPLAEDSIQSLLSVSSKPKFPDGNVCDFNEIASEKLRVIIEPNTLSRVLNKARDVLGLTENSDLTAHLHNLLICSRGQFLRMNQSTQKGDNVIATLVIVLPSSHIGGDLIIQRSGVRGKKVFSTENIEEIKCIAFWADCSHAIQEIRHGHRVALTYHLVLQEDVVCENLKTTIKEYFAEKHSDKLCKFVYFLNNEYTETDLQWSMLKGIDRANASAFLKVAKHLNMVPHLALVKIEEEFATNSFWVHYDDDLPERSQLESSTVSLYYWLDAFNMKLAYTELAIEASEFCFTKDTADHFVHYDDDCCAGYPMGSQGSQTFYYRRAAVVLWEESSRIPMNFLLGNQKAIEDLLHLTGSPDNEKHILNVIQKAGNCLLQNLSEDCFVKLAQIALYLNDKDAAYNILSQFPRRVVSVDTAESLAKLQNKYGTDWCIHYLNAMEGCPDSYYIDKIDFFMIIFLENKGALQVAELLLAQQKIGKYKYESCIQLSSLFRACATVQNVPILHKIINTVIASPDYEFFPLVDLFLNLKNKIPSNYYINFEPLKIHFLKSVNDELASLGERSDSDWSITVDMPCSCEICREALMFLNSKTEISKQWHLRGSQREHVTTKLKLLRLPLNITVKRSNSLSKLIIEKDISMHQKYHDRYKELKDCQEKLNSHTF